MNTAMAEGDVQALRGVCALSLAEKLSVIALANSKPSHKPGERGARKRWEVIRYEGSPKLTSSCLTRMPDDPSVRTRLGMSYMPMIQQSVVRIKSVQRLASWMPPPRSHPYDASSPSTVTTDSPPSEPAPLIRSPESKWQGWTLLPGSEKVVHQIEYLVILRQVHPQTYEFLSDWIIWGTTKPTSRDDMRAISEFEDSMKGKQEKVAEQNLKKMGVKVDRKKKKQP